MEALLRFGVMRLVGLRRRWERRAARRFTLAHTPELFEAYAAFDSASQSGSRRQPYKGWDLWMLLGRFQPSTIIELGSGTTSAVFALWARRHGAQYVCYEHHPEWARVTERCLRDARLVEDASPVNVVATRAREDGAANGFVEPIPPNSDFVYVDGPPTVLADGRKVPNDDVCRLLDSGARPRAIVVDGRLQTVDLIRSHPAASSYAFEPAFVYALRRGLWREAMEGREHSVFVLRADAKAGARGSARERGS